MTKQEKINNFIDKLIRKQNVSQETMDKLELKKQIIELENWFADYDKKVAQCNRRLRMGQDCRYSIVELDITATEKSKLLKQKRDELANHISINMQ